MIIVYVLFLIIVGLLLFIARPVIIVAIKTYEEEKNAQPAIAYSIHVKNSSDKDQTITLFNSRKNRFAYNYGNPPGIDVTFIRNGMDYSSLLADTEYFDMKIGLLRLLSNNQAQLNKTINWRKYTSVGDAHWFDIPPYPNMMQNLSYVCEIPTNFRLNGNCQLEFELLAGAEIIISLFPYIIVNNGNVLDGKSIVSKFKAPKHINENTKIALSKSAIKTYTGLLQNVKYALKLLKQGILKVYFFNDNQYISQEFKTDNNLTGRSLRDFFEKERKKIDNDLQNNFIKSCLNDFDDNEEPGREEY